jgi:hypothetical protein
MSPTLLALSAKKGAWDVLMFMTATLANWDLTLDLFAVQEAGGGGANTHGKVADSIPDRTGEFSHQHGALEACSFE